MADIHLTHIYNDADLFFFFFPVAKYDAHCYTKQRYIIAGNIFFEKSKHTMFSCP